jgi:hypothetical protein
MTAQQTARSRAREIELIAELAVLEMARALLEDVRRDPAGEGSRVQPRLSPLTPDPLKPLHHDTTRRTTND